MMSVQTTSRSRSVNSGDAATMPHGVPGGMASAEKARKERADGYAVAQEQVRQARLNGGASGTVIPMQRQHPKESWEILSEWAEKRGWGSYRLAGAMILAATQEEKKRLPEQRVLSGYWRRWLKGETIPDGSRNRENWVFRPIIARMMGIDPDMIWNPRKPRPETVMEHGGNAFGHNDPLGGSPVHGALKRRLSIVSSTLEKYRKELEYLEKVQQIIGDLEAEMHYLNMVLAVPIPADLPLRQADETDSIQIQA